MHKLQNSCKTFAPLKIIYVTYFLSKLSGKSATSDALMTLNKLPLQVRSEPK